MKIEDFAILRRPDCPICLNWFVCEDHPDRPLKHEDCGGDGVPCQAPGCVQEAIKTIAQGAGRSPRRVGRPEEGSRGSWANTVGACQRRVGGGGGALLMNRSTS